MLYGGIKRNLEKKEATAREMRKKRDVAQVKKKNLLYITE